VLQATAPHLLFVHLTPATGVEGDYKKAKTALKKAKMAFRKATKASQKAPRKTKLQGKTIIYAKQPNKIINLKNEKNHCHSCAGRNLR